MPFEGGYEAVAGERRRSHDLNGQQRSAHELSRRAMGLCGENCGLAPALASYAQVDNDSVEEAAMPERLGAKHWRERAEEAHTLADQMNDGDARRSMFTIAAVAAQRSCRAAAHLDWVSPVP